MLKVAVLRFEPGSPAMRVGALTTVLPPCCVYRGAEDEKGGNVFAPAVGSGVDLASVLRVFLETKVPRSHFEGKGTGVGGQSHTTP